MLDISVSFDPAVDPVPPVSGGVNVVGRVIFVEIVVSVTFVGLGVVIVDVSVYSVLDSAVKPNPVVLVIISVVLGPSGAGLISDSDVEYTDENSVEPVDISVVVSPVSDAELVSFSDDEDASTDVEAEISVVVFSAEVIAKVSLDNSPSSVVSEADIFAGVDGDDISRDEANEALVPISAVVFSDSIVANSVEVSSDVI